MLPLSHQHAAPKPLPSLPVELLLRIFRFYFQADVISTELNPYRLPFNFLSLLLVSHAVCHLAIPFVYRSIRINKPQDWIRFFSREISSSRSEHDVRRMPGDWALWVEEIVIAHGRSYGIVRAPLDMDAIEKHCQTFPCTTLDAMKIWLATELQSQIRDPYFDFPKLSRVCYFYQTGCHDWDEINNRISVITDYMKITSGDDDWCTRPDEYYFLEEQFVHGIRHTAAQHAHTLNANLLINPNHKLDITLPIDLSMNTFIRAFPSDNPQRINDDLIPPLHIHYDYVPDTVPSDYDKLSMGYSITWDQDDEPDRPPYTIYLHDFPSECAAHIYYENRRLEKTQWGNKFPERWMWIDQSGDAIQLDQVVSLRMYYIQL